ncbi:SDR family oxidoreductase [Algoriphagus terrigena]|uniref:SDR family NAD(P)-dependent oxidoreductase n=1 Tax=Algoriphagus terrigena TaxID=344884 RepID=UPI0003F808DC
MNVSLKNQRILVTGSSRGIGRAIAKQLSDSGAEVIIHCNANKAQAESLLSELKNPAFIEACDLSKPDEVMGFIPHLVKKYGPLTALVNNAGISTPAADSMPTGEWLQVWEKVMAVNSTAVGILSKEFIDQAKIHHNGRIVMISSRAAFRGDTPDYLAYAARAQW